MIEEIQLPEWMLSSEAKERRERARRMRRIVTVTIFALAFIAAVLLAGYSDTQALALGLIH